MSVVIVLTDAQKLARSELSRKLNLLMDVITAPDGKVVTYRMIGDYLANRGISLGRARWAYMLAGDRHLVEDQRLLSAIADFFEVPADYLLGSPNAEIPRKVEAALQYVRAERLGAVRLFAARKLGDISPETLEKLTAILDEASDRATNSPPNDPLSNGASPS